MQLVRIQHTKRKQKLGELLIDVHRRGGVQQRSASGRCAARRAAARSSPSSSPDGEHHEQRTHDVGAGDHARALGGGRALLDQGVQRHDEEAAEDGQQRQIGDDPPAARPGEELAAARATRPRAAPPRGAPARKRSKAKTLMPIEPSGTSPSSSLRPEKRSQSSEPTPMPTQNSARNKRDHVLVGVQHASSCRSAAATSTAAPKNQNHDTPRTERNTVRFCVISA